MVLGLGACGVFGAATAELRLARWVLAAALGGALLGIPCPLTADGEREAGCELGVAGGGP